MFVVFFLFIVLVVVDGKTLSMGWEAWEPYQYRNESGVVTGLDIELCQAIVKNAGLNLELKERPWARHLKEVEEGKIDLAAGASKTPERDKYANFSNSYRTESAVLFIRKSDVGKYKFKSLLDITGKFQIGSERGYFYGKEFSSLYKKADFKKHLQETTSGETNLKKLMKKRVDGVLIDPISARALLKKMGDNDKVEILFTVYSDEIFMMTSKKSVSKDVMTKLNASLKKMKGNGSYQKILNKYLK